MHRILIIDDSAVARAVVTRLIDESDRHRVVGAVPHIAAAQTFLADQRVDVILLDLELPGVNGLDAIADLLVRGDGARILVVSSLAGEGAAASIQALALGAADTLVKPGATGLASRFGAELIDRLDRLVGDDHPQPPQPVAIAGDEKLPTAILPEASYDLVAIGASTGGMHALSAMLRGLPASFDVPMLVTQHLPASFMPYFAAQLALIAERPCDIATHRMPLRRGRIVVAPGDAHLRCVASRGGGVAVALSNEAVESGCLPSVDPMLSSAAEICGERVLGVILSGMGRDGAQGAAAVHRAGGRVLVQDRASSVVWGMPGAVVAQGAADAILPPASIGMMLAAMGRGS